MRQLAAAARRVNACVEWLERKPWLSLAFISIVYFAVVLLLASAKLFWNDELFTFYIARRPGMPDVWAALLTGAEQLPPVFYVITRAFAGAFGGGLLGFRLPEIVAFWVMMVSLFLFVRTRLSSSYGLLALTFPLVTEGLYYGYEARPYAMVLGFAALALVCWQASERDENRKLALAGFALSLAAALSSHYYAILIFAPFFLGEVVRFIARRKLDLPILAAMAVGLLPIALFLPLIQAARHYAATFWAKPQWTNIAGFYSYLLFPALLFLVAAPALLAFFSANLSRRSESQQIREGFPPHEVAVIICFAILPVLAVFLAKTVTGAFTYRYALPALIGVSILIAWSFARLSRNLPAGGLALTALTLAIFLVGSLNTYRGWKGSAQFAQETLDILHVLSANGIPIVIDSPHLYFELSHLGGEEGAPYLTYLADRQLALQYTGTDTVELGLVQLSRWAPLRVSDFRKYTESHASFALYGYGSKFSWVMQELTKQGWHFEAKPVPGRQPMLIATRGGS